MSDKVKNIIYTLLDYGLTWGGPAGLVVYTYISEDTSTGFKLSFTGILLLIALVFTAKAQFTKKYRDNYDLLLQQLGLASSQDDKEAISKKIDNLKTTSDIYSRITLLLPFAVLYIVSYFGQMALAELQSVCGFVLLSMGAGSVFGVLERPVKERIKLQKILKK